MELKLMKQSTMPSELCFDSFAEIPIECDLLLPDYCPDVMKVLKCTAQPCVTSRTLAGDKLSIEGHFELCMYYADESHRLRRYEYRHSFAKMFDLKSAPENPMVSVSCNVDYLNPRAVNPRRVEVRGAATMAVKVLAPTRQECVADAEGCGVQTRKQTMPFSAVVGSTRKQFTLRENLDCGHAKLTVDSVLHTVCVPTSTEVKLMPGKVVVQGEVSLDVLCADADGNTEILYFTLPISQLIDLDGVDDGCTCSLRIEPLSAVLTPTESAGEEPSLAAEITLAAQVHAFRRSELSVLTDAYSTTYPAACSFQTLQMVKLLDTVDERSQHEETVEMPPDMQQLLRMWAEARYLSCERTAGGLQLTGKLTICMIALDDQGMPGYFERTGELSIPCALQADDTDVIADLRMCTVHCSGEELPGRELALKVTVQVCGELYAVQTVQVMADLSVDEQNPKQPDRDAALKIYYADRGECVWDIAKHYNTCVAAVLEENALSEDVLPEHRALLIPLIL